MTTQSQIVVVVCTIVLAWQIVAALVRGRISATRTAHFDRSDQPVEYWGLVTVQLAVAVGLAWFAYRSAVPKPPSHADRIYAVTAAVREEMPRAKSAAAFANVRADAQSGFVCGEVTLEDGRRRFFGNVAGDKARAVIEQQDQRNFDATFDRRCGGKWVLPRPA